MCIVLYFGKAVLLWMWKNRLLLGPITNNIIDLLLIRYLHTGRVDLYLFNFPKIHRSKFNIYRWVTIRLVLTVEHCLLLLSSILIRAYRAMHLINNSLEFNMLPFSIMCCFNFEILQLSNCWQIFSELVFICDKIYLRFY